MAEQKFDFNNLFVFEMANNHQGSVDHGLRIIREIADAVYARGIRGAIKLQFRELDSFIHPSHRNGSDNKHIPRFISTRLSENEFRVLVEETKNKGLISMCTPFDEPSVGSIERLGIEVIKIGSCSATDWPLLEIVAEAGKPVIFSTGGLRLEDIDKTVSFFKHRGVNFAFMHCIALYPTPNEDLQLNQIEILRNRYPGITIGFSTHEEPGNVDAVKVAYAKGARIFEKHVGVPTEEFSINAYSSTPQQIADWLDAHKQAVDMCGSESRPSASEEEIASLKSLMRGVYARKDIWAGSILNRDDIYFAMPPVEGQLVSGEWKHDIVADRDYITDEPISDIVIKNRAETPRETIARIVHKLKGMLNEAHVEVGYAPTVELSHHYGLENFNEYGTSMIECINREYCKKIIVQLPGQKHPLHYHFRKEESFQLLSGELIVEVEGYRKPLYPGDMLVIPRGSWHGFSSTSGAIFEEISTTHFNDDSFYADKEIRNISREERKTRLINWGRSSNLY